MRTLIISLLILGCTPEIEVRPLNERPICIYGVRKVNNECVPGELEFIKCSPIIDPYGFPDWCSFQTKIVNDCDECN